MDNQRNKTPSHRVQDAKEDFWDLGDDDLDLDPTEPAQDHAASEASPIAAEAPQQPMDIAPQEGGATDTGGFEKTPAPQEEPALTAASPSGQGDFKSSESTKTEIKKVVKKEEEEDVPHFGKIDTAPTSVFEKIGIVVVLACIIGAFAWGLSTFIKEAPQGALIEFIEDFPAKGESVTVSAVETWWKKPVRSGEDADVGIVLEANLVPCARITLSESGSTTLQVSFRDGEGQLIGDTINLSVQEGQFTRSGSQSVEIYATSGFDNASKINAYTNGDIDPWALVITEESANDKSEPLVKARITSDSNEEE